MNILVVCQYYYPEPFRITDICENLVESGHQVTVLTGLPNYPEGKILDEYKQRKKRKEVFNGVNIIRCIEIGRGKSKIKLFLNYISFMISGSFKTLFLKEKFDVIFVYQLSPIFMVIPAIIYKKIKGIKILLYCLDLWPDSLMIGGISTNSFIYKCIYIISKWIYSSVDTIMVTSTMFKKYFENVLHIKNIKINYLPQYAEDLFEHVKYNNKNQYDNNLVNLVFAGNIGEMQSVETIILAANELKEDKEIKFHIVGDGSKLEQCKSLTDQLKLTNVIFHGRKPISDMPSFYNMADAMLVTFKDNKTLSYTVPGKVQSYMAASKPILGSINGETQHIINDAFIGFCCNAEDFKEFANVITKFKISTVNERNRMSQNSYHYYLSHYSKDHFFYELNKELRNLEVKRSV
jgi:glycosyltransferase involved in cell wall biosynthesis